MTPAMIERLDRLTDALRRRPVALIAAIVSAEWLCAGFSAQDNGLGAYYGAVLSGSAQGVTPDHQFLLESVLPNEIGAVLTRAGLHGFALFWTWWGLGLMLLAGALAWAVRSGALSLAALAALLAFGRLADTLSLWVFKSDPYLLAFVVLSLTAANAPAAVAFTLLAGLCHPSLAFLSAIGMFLADGLMHNRLRWRWLIGGGLALVAGELATHLAVGAINGRLEHNLETLGHTVLRGLLTAPPFLLGTVAVPMAGLAALDAARPGKIQPGPWLAAAVGWIALIALFSMFLVEDHTRVFTLALFGAFALFAQHATRNGGPAAALSREQTLILLLLFTARLSAPHVDFSGARVIELHGLVR